MKGCVKCLFLWREEGINDDEAFVSGGEGECACSVQKRGAWRDKNTFRVNMYTGA